MTRQHDIEFKRRLHYIQIILHIQVAGSGYKHQDGFSDGASLENIKQVASSGLLSRQRHLGGVTIAC